MSCDQCGKSWENGTCGDTVSRRARCKRTAALYGDLHGARERLCRAQTFVPTHWKSDLQAALDHIDQAGSALCPDRWSRYDQPEYEETAL